MDSDQLSFKNIPYIPPSSPPPIDTIPKEVDYEISDNEGAYDITGLSQKFNLSEEENLKASHLLPEKEFLKDKIYGSKTDSMYLDNEHCYTPEEDYIRSTYEISEDCRHLSAMSPPPLNYDEISNESCPDSKVDSCDKDAVSIINDSSSSKPDINIDNEEKLIYENIRHDLDRKINDEHIRDNFEINENSNNEYNPSALENSFDNQCKISPIVISNKCVNDFSDNVNDTSEKDISIKSVDSTDFSTQTFKHESHSTDYHEYIDANLSENDNKDVELENNKPQSASLKLSIENENNKLSIDEFQGENTLPNMDSEECIKKVSEHRSSSELREEVRDENDKNLSFINEEIVTKLKDEEDIKKESNTKLEDEEDMKNESNKKLEDDENMKSEVENKNNDCELNLSASKPALNQLEVNDDDDDFGDFSSVTFNASLPEVDCVIPTSKVSSNDEQEDEFGDFAFSRECRTAIETVNTENDNLRNFQATDMNPDQEEIKDDYGDFGEFSNYQEETRTIDYPEFEIHHDENEFGEFNSIESTKSLQLEFSDDEEEDLNVTKPMKDSKEILKETNIDDNKFQHLILRWTPISSSESTSDGNENENIGKLADLVESDTFMWCHLADIDSSQALQLSWPNSRVNKLFLASLNVDARNILFGHKPKWSSTIPLFAQTLSFSPLTPLKPSSVSNTWNLDNKTSDLDQSPVIAEKVESPPVITSPKRVRDSETKIIPPAQFDWSSSGLTNPLDGPACLSSLLDYKIISHPRKNRDESGSASFSHLSRIEKEILTLSGGDKTCAMSMGSKPQVSPSPILEKILKESERGPKGKRLNTNLTSLPCEVKEVVQKIPDLNFMSAKVLMFPILEET